MAFVCLCNRVSEYRVQRAIDRGACCVETVGDDCGAGTDCFGCHDTIERLLDERGVTGPRLRRAG